MSPIAVCWDTWEIVEKAVKKLIIQSRQHGSRCYSIDKLKERDCHEKTGDRIQGSGYY